MRIAVIKLGAKGDVVRTLPILVALKEKFPNSEIFWFTKPSSQEIVRTSPFVKEVVTDLDSLDPESFGEFDILYNLDIDEKALMLADSLKAKSKLGFRGSVEFPEAFNLPAEYYLNTMFDDDLKKENKKSYQKMMFEAAELVFDSHHHPIFLEEPQIKYAEDFMKKNNIDDKRLLGIHIGSSSRWPSKKWHPDNIKEFIRMAYEEGFEILLFGGPEEEEYLNEIIGGFKDTDVRVFQNNPLNTDLEFFSLVDRCQILVCGDSFALHVALALKKPTVGLFFCTPPDEIEGYSLLKKIVSPRLYDFFPEKMDIYDEELAKSITAKEVLDAVLKMNKKKFVKVVNAVVKDGDRFLLIKRKEGFHKGKWAFPGGIVEKDESLKDALKREVFEETGLKVTSVGKKVSEFQFSRGQDMLTLGKCFIVETENKEAKVGDDVTDIRWVSLEELEDIKTIEGLPDEALTAFSL